MVGSWIGNGGIGTMRPSPNRFTPTPVTVIVGLLSDSTPVWRFSMAERTCTWAGMTRATSVAPPSPRHDR